MGGRRDQPPATASYPGVTPEDGSYERRKRDQGLDWLANFAIIEVFPVTQNAISLGGVMVVFAGLAALAIVFIWKFLPETKGLPVEEIVRVFERQQRQSPLSSGPTDASAHAAS